MAVQFKYKKSLYTKQAIKDSGILTTDQMEAEYKRLARYKNARIDRLESKYPRAEILKETDRAPKWGELLDKNGNVNMTKLSYEMNDAYRFLKKNITTVKGFSKQLKKSINSFNNLFNDSDTKKKDRYEPFNESNIWDLFDFLDDYRNKYNVQKIPDSDQLIDIVNEGSVRQEIDIESLKQDLFNYLDTNKSGNVSKYLNELKNNERPFGAEDYRKELSNS